MAKTIILIIIGLALGLAAAVALPYFRQPPNRRAPRPNQFKKNKLKQIIGPAMIGLAVALLAWAGISALFSSRTPDENRFSNAITQNLTQPRPHNRETPETKPLIAHTPIVRSALAVSPVSSVLERIGVGGRLAKLSAARPPAIAAAGSSELNALAAANAPSTKPTVALPPASSAPSGGGLKFTVHLASFGVRDNAERVVANLKSSGVPAYVSTIVIDGKTYYRLMAGAFDSEAQARAYGRRLEEGGLIRDLGPYTVRPFYSAPDSG
jgi:cell division septation protein DedD